MSLISLSKAKSFYPKYSPVKYSYFSHSADDNADILAANLSTLY